MLNYLNLNKIIHRQEKKDAIENKEKYDVRCGNIVVEPNKLVESEKVKQQLKALKKHFETQKN